MFARRSRMEEKRGAKGGERGSQPDQDSKILKALEKFFFKFITPSRHIACKWALFCSSWVVVPCYAENYDGNAILWPKGEDARFLSILFVYMFACCLLVCFVYFACLFVCLFVWLVFFAAVYFNELIALAIF